MPTSVSCPSCGARLNLRDELVGRRVKCPKCGETFQSSADATSEPAPPPMYAPSPSPTARGTGDEGFSPGAKLVVKTGVSCMIFGVLALILPMFGLQFKRLEGAGDKAPAVAIGLIVAGGVLVGLAYLRRVLGGGVTKAVKWVVLGGAAAVILIVVAAVGLSVLSKTGRTMTSSKPSAPVRVAPQSPPPPAPARSPAAGPAGPSGPLGPRVNPRPQPTADRPPQPQHPPAVEQAPRAAGAPVRSEFGPAYDSLVRQFGAEKVWRIVPGGAIEPRDRGAVHTRLADFVRDHSGTRYVTGSRGGLSWSIAPIEQADAEVLARSLDFGSGPASVNAAERTLTVTVKAAQP